MDWLIITIIINNNDDNENNCNLSIPKRIQSAKILLVLSKCKNNFVGLWNCECSFSNSDIGLFSIAPHIVIALSIFRKQNLLLLCFIFGIDFVQWLMTSFLYCSSYSYCASNYRDKDSCHSFLVLKVAITKCKGKLIAVAFKSKKKRKLSRR